MEELLASIPNSDIRDYMREAMSCYMAGAYRGALVLSYIALFDDFLAKLGELAHVNSTANKIFLDATKRKTDQDVYESYLIDQLTSKNLISGLDSSFLTTLRTLRNKSAHPSGHKPSAEEARFVFFETVSRFLSQPILSTTHLVDDLISRLKNSNFFPSIIVLDITNVVSDEIANLHDEAIPQLIAKLTASVTSADTAAAKNSGCFLIGLAKLDKLQVSSALQTKLITPKADDDAYGDLITQILSANGKLFISLSSTTVARVRAILAKKISEITSVVRENSLSHPTVALTSIAAAISEKELTSVFAVELKALFERRANSEFVIKLVRDKPSLLTIYFPVLLARAGSSDFGIAKTFSDAAESLDVPLSKLLTDVQSFQLIVAVLSAASWGSWSAKGLTAAKFAGTPHLRAKALAYISSNADEASKYIEQELTDSRPISEFVSTSLTDEKAV